MSFRSGLPFTATSKDRLLILHGQARPSKTSLAVAQPSDFPGSGSALRDFPGSSSALRDFPGSSSALKACHGISLCITEEERCRRRATVRPPGCHPRQDEVLLWARGGCQSGTAGGRYRSHSLVSHTHTRTHTSFSVHADDDKKWTTNPLHAWKWFLRAPLDTVHLLPHTVSLSWPRRTHPFISNSTGWGWGEGGGGGGNIAHTPTHTLLCIDSATHTSNTHIYKNNSEGDTDTQCCNVSPTRQERRRASAPLGTPVVELKSITPRGTRQRHSCPACLRNQVKPVPRPASFSSRAAQTQCKESVFPFIAAQQLVGLQGQNCPGSGFNSIVSVSAVDNRAVFSHGSLSISSDSNDTSGNVLPVRRRPLTITGSGLALSEASSELSAEAGR